MVHLRSRESWDRRKHRDEERQAAYAIGRKIVHDYVLGEANFDEWISETTCLTTEREAYEKVKPILEAKGLPFVHSITRDVENALVLKTPYNDGAWQFHLAKLINLIRR